MTESVVYLDHAATTPCRPEVVQAMLPYLQVDYGNPSSLHGVGRQAARAVSQARQTVAQLLQAECAEDVVFTSGGSESNNLAIKGLAFGLKDKGRHIITSGIEHSAVLEPCAWLAGQGWEITQIPVNAGGFFSPSDLEAAIRPDTVLVSLMHGNNEMGAIQPIEALGEIARSRGVLFHTDAVQTVGKIPVELKTLPVDLLSASGHKFYGPKGVGVLVANAAARKHLTPWIHGGGQQGGFRSGTENVAAIVGFVKALELAVAELDQTREQLIPLQEALIAGILAAVPTAILNGPRDLSLRVPGNANFSFAPTEGELLVLRFDLEGICISSGSACHSSKLTGSHVLHALGRSKKEAEGSVRFSMGRQTTMAHVQKVLDVLPDILKKAGYYRNHSLTATIN